ncbi:MAG: GspH/FimT family pseudopilin [Gammaproteobacteria bacterium]|nr:GspH/FimT family pseudopilin [Gammaproteobacteria bacterium]
MAHAPRASERGITLPELLITVVVAAVLVAIAVPNMRTFMQNTSRAGRVNSLVGALSFARSEAVTRGQQTTVCPGGASDNDCNPSAAGSEWIFNTGFLVMAVTSVGSTPVVAKRFSPDMGSATLHGAVSRFSYTPLGQPENGETWFRYCDTRGDPESRIVFINATGRAGSYELGDLEIKDLSVPSCP